MFGAEPDAPDALQLFDLHWRRLVLADLGKSEWARICLLYTSDAADERSSVDLGGRRIIKKKKNITIHSEYNTQTTQ